MPRKKRPPAWARGVPDAGPHGAYPSSKGWHPGQPRFKVASVRGSTIDPKKDLSRSSGSGGGSWREAVSYYILDRCLNHRIVAAYESWGGKNAPGMRGGRKSSEEYRLALAKEQCDRLNKWDERVMADDSDGEVEEWPLAHELGEPPTYRNGKESSVPAASVG